MVTITINNSYSRIAGLTAIQEKQLKAELSYVVGGSSSYYSGFGPRKKSLLDKKGNFPTGLKYKVSSWLHATKTKFLHKDARTRPKRMPDYVLPVVPYISQTKAVDIALIKERGIISMPTGSGKSLVIALIVSRLNVKTLVVVPSLEIKKQLVEALKSAGVPDKVTVENIDSNALDKCTDFDCLIIDEAHHVAAKTYQKLNAKVWTGIFYRFFLTATPFRNDLEEMMLFEAIAGKVIYQLSYKDAVKEGYIVPVEAYYVEVPKQETEAHTWQQVYSQLVVNNNKRNEIIALTLLRFNASNVSTLCLVKEVAHGKALAELTGLPFISGEDDESRQYIRQFSAKQITAVIATTGIMGEGVDTKACECVIVAGLGKAKSQFMQQVGRGVRRFEGKESCKVILVRDISHKFTLRHYNAQRRILKDEYGTIPLKLEI